MKLLSGTTAIPRSDYLRVHFIPWPNSTSRYPPPAPRSSRTGQETSSGLCSKCAEDDITLKIGPKLREAREAREISVRSLAQKTGFSPSFLSQVELGQSSPSLASLQRICNALEIEMPDLLRDSSRAHRTPVLRRSERESIRSDWSKASAESLVPSGSNESFSAMLLSMDAGGRTGALPSRKGSHEFAYCIRGQVQLKLGDQTFELSRGDSVVVDRTAASWENSGRGRAEVLVISMRSR